MSEPRSHSVAMTASRFVACQRISLTENARLPHSARSSSSMRGPARRHVSAVGGSISRLGRAAGLLAGDSDDPGVACEIADDPRRPAERVQKEVLHLIGERRVDLEQCRAVWFEHSLKI